MRFSTISSAAIIVGTGLAQTPGASPVGLNVIIADLGRVCITTTLQCQFHFITPTIAGGSEASAIFPSGHKLRKLDG